MERTKRKNSAEAVPLTTSQKLGNLLKSARALMRKDKGLNGDLDRLPLLTWIMFLKFLDDLERQREDEARVGSKKFKPAIEPPYRWRDWAENSQGITGDELRAFINNDEAMRPDGTKGPGLFAYLRALSSSNGDNRRDVIATVFKGVDNRMKSGYMLRDVINKVAGIHFTSSDELHTLGALYESMLREMRDAAGDSGEFYTPRSVVRFMVEVTNPRLGEVVLDPASGTGGFLVEAYSHLEKQVKTVADRKRLQGETIFGCEPKSLPYLLCQMNLLLHGLDAPQIDPDNALRFKLSEIGERDRVDVILTNPPFGGEEERGIQGNFPDDLRTSETALLFLQLIMRKLKRGRTLAGAAARAAVVVPESVMSDPGVAQRVRKQLVQNFNLHTVVRMPKGVFEPYSDIQTNILFFDTAGGTTETWYYQHEIENGGTERRDPKYTVTSPLLYEEMEQISDWAEQKRSFERAWKVPVLEIEKGNFTLDFRNPARPVAPTVSVTGASEKISAYAAQVLEAVTELKKRSTEIEKIGQSKWSLVPIHELLTRNKQEAEVQDDLIYKQITVRLYGKGVIERCKLKGGKIKTRPQFIASSGELIMSRIDARNGAFGVVPPDLHGALVTQDFPLFSVNLERILPGYLALLLKSDVFMHLCKRSSRGTTNRKRLKEELFLGESIPLPPKEVQNELLKFAQSASRAAAMAVNVAEQADQIERHACSILLHS